MLSEEQLNEIRGHLEKAQNPLFFFDNDPDGLCAFLIMQRYLGRGKGIPIKSYPKLDVQYFKRVLELNPDYIFILDKPEVSEEFLEEVEKINLPVVWIDHHNVNPKFSKSVNYYNSFKDRDSFAEPTTYIAYCATKKEQDLWLGVVGCISDKFIPYFYKDFVKNYPDLSINFKELSNLDAFDIFYSSPVGTLSKLFGYGLKQTTTNVVRMLKYLMKAKNPYDVLKDSRDNEFIHKKFNSVEKIYQKYLLKAVDLAESSGKILFFKYGGDLKVSSELSNELSYRFPEKTIVVVYDDGVKVLVSLRGMDVRTNFLEAIKGIESASGGGHERAVGGQMDLKDLEVFKKRFFELVVKG